jgi:hypothetical protein
VLLPAGEAGGQQQQQQQLAGGAGEAAGINTSSSGNRSSSSSNSTELLLPQVDTCKNRDSRLRTYHPASCLCRSLQGLRGLEVPTTVLLYGIIAHACLASDLPTNPCCITTLSHSAPAVRQP